MFMHPKCSLQTHPRFLGHGAHGVDRLEHEFAERAGAQPNGCVARVHALQIQDVVDQADEAVGVGARNPQEVGGAIVHLAHKPCGE